MPSRLIEALQRYSEPALLGAIALGAVAAAGTLVGYDLLHAPGRIYPAAAAAASAPPPTITANEKAPLPANRSVVAAEAAAQTRGEMSDVTLFQQVPVDFGNGRTYGVVTGLVYPNTRAATPSSQYCYLQAGNVSAAAKVTVSLASKNGADGRIEPAGLDEADARAVGLPLKRIRESAASCRFI